jgi:ribonuclease R
MPKKDQKHIGIISITRRGVGYVAVDNFKEDVEIDPENLGTALHTDTVEMALGDKKRGRQQGIVVRIVKRARTRFVGVLEEKDGKILLIPDDRRMYTPLHVDAGVDTLGQKALVELTKWDSVKSMPQGKLIRTLGPAGTHEVEMESIVLEKGFDTHFPSEVEKEAQRIKEHDSLTDEEVASRRDFRDVTTFTIDPEDAKDFDDALSVRFLENGDVEVGIHIADVSYYVTPGTELDNEAQERGTSIYLVDRTIPMLPEVLSNDLCSLNPEEDKRAYAAVFVLDSNAHVKESWFGSTLIRSDKRFTYEEAQKVLDEGNGPFLKELRMLNSLAEKMRGKRAQKGSIAFEQDEVKFKLDKDGKPLAVFRKERFDTNLLIEDFMLLANREVATYFNTLCKKSGLTEPVFVYRIHDIPDTDKIEELALFLKAVGYEFETNKGEVTGKEINRLFKQIEGKPEKDLIKTATIRSMTKAIYSTRNIGHFGLAFEYYTHFTSPIRRYPDIMVHRIMRSHLNGEPLSKRELQKYEGLAIQSSQREVAAVEAERDSVKFKQVEFMKEYVGETFDGIVSGVTERGLFVEETKTKSDGMIKVRNMKDDYYTLDEKHYRLVGQRTKRTYSLGDRVRIRLIDANLKEKTLEWTLVEK